MFIDSKKLNGPCICGHSHEMATKAVVIESGCLMEFGRYVKGFGLEGRCAAVYDQNTYHAAGLIRPAADQEIILDSNNLHANEIATSSVSEQLEPDIKFLVAVGSGTIHDITRYCAHRRGIPFVACPTAASVDGFCSTVSAMTWEGYKKTLPGRAPDLVLADIDVIKEAPISLALSGVGDILGKYTALADWKIAHALNGEFFCPFIEGMTRDAVRTVYQCCEKIQEKDEEAFIQLTYGLLLSGLAMQLMGNSRPASGAEHHISHLLEMDLPLLKIHSAASHGEKVGVGAAIVSGEYHRLARIQEIEPLIHPYQFPALEEMTALYGEKLLPSVLEENKGDCMDGVTPQMLIDAWPEICKIIEEIPTEDELTALYAKIGAKKTLEDIGVPSCCLEPLLKYSPSVRNRLTFMRVRWMIRS